MLFVLSAHLTVFKLFCRVDLRFSHNKNADIATVHVYFLSIILKLNYTAMDVVYVSTCYLCVNLSIGAKCRLTCDVMCHHMMVIMSISVSMSL